MTEMQKTTQTSQTNGEPSHLFSIALGSCCTCALLFIRCVESSHPSNQPHSHLVNDECCVRRSEPCDCKSGLCAFTVKPVSMTYYELQRKLVTLMPNQVGSMT